MDVRSVHQVQQAFPSMRSYGRASLSVQQQEICCHFHSNVCWSPPILTSKMPGSTTRLLSAPMKDKSSGVNSKETFRLSPGCSITFANHLSRFNGGVTLANRSFKYS